MLENNAIIEANLVLGFSMGFWFGTLMGMVAAYFIHWIFQPRKNKDRN